MWEGEGHGFRALGTIDSTRLRCVDGVTGRPRFGRVKSIHSSDASGLERRGRCLCTQHLFDVLEHVIAVEGASVQTRTQFVQFRQGWRWWTFFLGRLEGLPLCGGGWVVVRIAIGKIAFGETANAKHGTRAFAEPAGALSSLSDAGAGRGSKGAAGALGAVGGRIAAKGVGGGSAAEAKKTADRGSSFAGRAVRFAHGRTKHVFVVGRIVLGGVGIGSGYADVATAQITIGPVDVVLLNLGTGVSHGIFGAVLGRGGMRR